MLHKRLIKDFEVEPEVTAIKEQPDGKTCPSCIRYFAPGPVVCSDCGTLLIQSKNFKVVNVEVAAAFAGDRYKIDEWKGEGDLSNVFYAVDKKSHQEVVIKIIKSHMLGGEARRIRKLADTLHETIGLQHPNIVTVMDSGIAKATERSQPQGYVVLEKLKGFRNLKATLHHFGPLSPYMVVETMVKACETFEYAHSQGWLHQDIKPSNIYISMREEQIAVKISDFAVAARMFSNLEWENIGTKTGSIYGNAAYMSPDVTYALEPSVASDVYSLGCTMYHILKGMPPFEGNNDFDTLMMHRDKLPKPFAAELEVPKALEAIVMKCLEKKPENRYQSFKALATELNAIT